METALLPCLLALAMSPNGYAQPIKVSVVAVESIDDLEAWLGKPIDPARAAAVASYPAPPRGVATPPSRAPRRKAPSC